MCLLVCVLVAKARFAACPHGLPSKSRLSIPSFLENVHCCVCISDFSGLANISAGRHTTHQKLFNRLVITIFYRSELSIEKEPTVVLNGRD